MSAEITPDFNDHPGDRDLIGALFGGVKPWQTDWNPAIALTAEPIASIWNLDDDERLAQLDILIDTYANEHWDELADATVHHAAHGTLGYANCEEADWPALVDRAQAVAINPDGIWPIEVELIRLIDLRDQWTALASKTA